MAPRTRSTTSSPVKKTSVVAGSACTPRSKPTKVIIVPKDIADDAKILSLKHPRDGDKKRFLFCPLNGLYEFTKTATPPIDPHSIVFQPVDCIGSVQTTAAKEADQFSEGWISKDAEMFLATKFDVSFVLLKILLSQTANTKKMLFQSLDDLLDTSGIEDESLNYILQNGRQLVEDGMSAICDIVDAGDEKMYRYSEKKAQELILTKAERVVQLGLPASLEDRFVTRILAPPFLSVKRENTASSPEATQALKTEETDSQVESLDSQSTTASTTVSVVFSELSVATAATSTGEDTIPMEMTNLQRLRVAQNFIIESYLPSTLAAHFRESMSTGSMATKFKALDDHLKHLASLRAEATASRSMTDFNRKRGLDEEEAAQDRAEKKKKHEEDEKRRKANESRGVRDLKKVNVSGMKKMSHFFAKQTTVTKAKT